MYNRKAMIVIINKANSYLKGILKKGEMIMNIYKKLFAYVEDKKYLGAFAIAFSVISAVLTVCLLYTSPSPRDRTRSRMPSSA